MLVIVQFVSTIILMISMGSLLYLSVRAMTRLEDEVISLPRQATLWKRLTTSGVLEKIDIILIRFLHRFLRRFHIFLLKLDNTLTAWLKNTRLKNEEEGILTEFKEMTGVPAQSPKMGDIVSDIQNINKA